MQGIIDLKDQRFGRLVVIADSGRRSFKNVVWECRCDCGTITFVIANNLRRSRSTSCGCLHREITSQRQLRHGHTSERLQSGKRYSSEYAIWRSMKARCHNQKAVNYADYGGRGITVCSRWLDSFEAFIADMGARPSHDHSIDRIDNDIGYEPSNCRWATDEQQRSNRRQTIFVTRADGSSVALMALAEERGIKYCTLFAALRRGRDVLTFVPRRRLR
jgi:hypothetical protein